MTDLLVKQYPPLFHAATDVHSFVRALSSMPNLQHLRINCDGQIPSHRYRRSIVDYALISLRIAVEQAPLRLLDSLSLLSIHPAAVLYLQPTLGFGASPASRKRWLQIHHLTMHMTSFSNEAGPTDHLKLLHTYMQSFPALRVLRFHWKGHKGLSPISLATETCLQRQCANVTTTSYGVSKIKASIRPLRLPTLEVMELVNVIIDASQIASFILDHRRSLQDFDLQDISLRTGTWDEALAPLTQLSGSDRWKQTQKKHESTINVPIFLSPVEISQKRLEEAIQVVGRQHEGLRGLFKNTRARDQLSGRPDHMKRLLPVSVVNWRR